MNKAPSWEQIASEPNDGRYDHVLAAYDDKIWAIGGTDDVTGTLPVRTYDPATNTWADVANSMAPWGDSEPRSGCQVGSRVYLYGDQFSYHGLVYYDMATNQWQQVVDAVNPPPLADIWAPAWVVDAAAGLCYLTGGGDNAIAGNGNLASVYAYHPTTNAWSTLPAFTTPRNWHAAFVTHRPTDNHKLLCIAGGNGKDNQNLASTQCYDFTVGAWNPENADLGPLPEALWGMGYTQRTSGLHPSSGSWLATVRSARPTLPSPSTSCMASGSTTATLLLTRPIARLRRLWTTPATSPVGISMTRTWRNTS